MLHIVPLVLGPVETNTYLVADPASGEAVVIDPADAGEDIVRMAQQHGWRIVAIWVTHAHFDHIGGIPGLLARVSPTPHVWLHPLEKPLWERKGGGEWFGFSIGSLPNSTEELAHGQWLTVGKIAFEVRHTPGHTPGHVVLYCAQEQVLFSGDVLFYEGIGRTDLPGGDHATLLHSIRQQVFTLPAETRVLPGHGPETTVGHERAHNPFVRG